MANSEGQGSPPNPTKNSDNDEDISSRRRVQTRPASGTDSPNLGLHVGASGAGFSAVRQSLSLHQIHIWPHVQARVSHPPLLPPPPPPPLPPPPFLPLAMLNYTFKCHVCGDGFYNIRALSGHMRVHPDRGWRGINPPSEPRPQGIQIRENIRPVSASANVGMPSGGSSALPPRHYDFDSMEAELRRVIEERNEERTTRDLGKRPALIDEAESSSAAFISKRGRVEGPVPDLNGSPPYKPDEGPNDDPKDGGDAAEGTEI